MVHGGFAHGVKCPLPIVKCGSPGGLADASGQNGTPILGWACMLVIVTLGWFVLTGPQVSSNDVVEFDYFFVVPEMRSVSTISSMPYCTMASL